MIQQSDVPGFVKDATSGLIIPERLTPGISPSRRGDSPFEQFLRTGRGGGGKIGVKNGEVRVSRDADTGIPVPPAYASGFDDLLARAVVGGWVSNVGLSGVIDPVISSTVSKLIQKCASWSPMVGGQRLARKNIMAAIAGANGSDVNWIDFASKIAAGVFIDNSGIAYAQMPVRSIAFESWDQYGMTAVPIDGYEDYIRERGSRSKRTVDIPRYYSLKVTNAGLRANRMLETIDILHARPTGNKEWPLWIRKELRGDYVWVLLHRSIAGHQVVTVNPQDDMHPAHGQSGVWRYMSVLMQDVLVSDGAIESMIYSPPTGIVWGTGLDFSEQLADAMEAHQKDRDEAGIKMFKGVMYGGSESERAGIVVVKWRETPEGYTGIEWKEQKEDYAAMCMGASVASTAQRPGKGVATQALLSYDMQSESLYAVMQKIYEGIYSWMSDQVTVRVVLKSDRAKRIQVETLRLLMEAVELAQKASDGEAYTADEIKALAEQEGGIDTPVGEVETDQSSLARIDELTISRRLYRRLEWASQLSRDDVVVLPNRELATVIETSATSYVWLKTAVDNAEVLYRVGRLKAIGT